MWKRKYPEDTYGYYNGGIILDTESDSDLGGYRFSDLKTGDPQGSKYGDKTIHHPKLKEAFQKHSSDEQKARDLHKEACREIFNQQPKSGRDERGSGRWDLENYCSKRIRDEFGENGTGPAGNKDEWNKKVGSLLDKNFRDFGGSDYFKLWGSYLKKPEEFSSPALESGAAGLNKDCKDMGDEHFSRLWDKGAIKVRWMKDVCFELEVNS